MSPTSCQTAPPRIRVGHCKDSPLHVQALDDKSLVIAASPCRVPGTGGSGWSTLRQRGFVGTNEKRPANFRSPAFCVYGAPGEIRTPDHQVRSLVLYPTELRAQVLRCFPLRQGRREARNYSHQGAPRQASCSTFDPAPAPRNHTHCDLAGTGLELAEREGFEPSIELLTLYSLSRGAPSASRASLRILPPASPPPAWP